MKKLVAVSILLMTLSAAAFAQFTVGLEAKIAPYLMQAQTPIGDFADPDKDYRGNGSFDAFTSTWKPPELRLKLGYEDPDKNYGGSLVFKHDNVIGMLFQNSATVSWNSLLASVTGDFTLYGKIGKFKGFFQNTAYRGEVDRLEGTFSDFAEIKTDGYGLWMPNPKSTSAGTNYNAPLGGEQWEIKNLQKGPANASLAFAGIEVTGLGPITVAAVGGGNNTVPDVPPTDYSKMNMGLMVSGKDLGPVTFNATYKLAGGDPSKKDDSDNPLPWTSDEADGQGVWYHAFGVYANIKAVDKLGIGIGYSGVATAQEKTETPEATTTHPYYNGIDLRVRFTGIDKLTIGLNNNISFAVATGDDDSKTDIKGIAGISGGLTKGQQETWFHLQNSLVVGYQVTEAFLARFTAINNFGSYAIADDELDTEAKMLRDRLVLGISGTYKATSHVELEGGLTFDIKHGTEVTNKDGDKRAGGVFAFSVPLRMKVAF